MQQGNDNMVRLFVAKGHMDHMNAGQVAQFLAREAGVNADDIQDIRVLEKFTFVSVPPPTADQILAVFEKNSKGRRSLVTRAKEKEGGGGGKSFGGSKREFRPKGDGFKSKSFEPREKKSFEPREKKPFEPREKKAHTFENKGDKDFSDKPRRRENKLTDYLDKKPAPAAPQQKKTADGNKPPKKKGDTSEVEKFMSKFDDDLSW